MKNKEIKDKMTTYYHTNEAYFNMLEDVFTGRGERALKIGSFDIISYVKDARKILDVGCGSGALITLIKKTFPEKDCYGIDLSPIAIQKAMEKIQESGVDITLSIADIEYETPFNEVGFDLIITHEVLEHFVNPDQALSNISKLLRRGGILLIIAPNRLVRSPIKTIMSKSLDYIKMLFDRNYLNITVINPPLDILGGDSDAAYVTNPWELQRMVRFAGLEVIKKSNLKCRLVARKK